MSFLFPFRGKKIKNTAKPRRANLSLETLEDRAVPAIYTVAGFADGLGFVSPTGPDSFNASTFRAAILAANASVGVDDVIILPAGVYDLTLQDEGDLDISDNVEIRGSGALATFIDASTLDHRIFDIESEATVLINGVTMGNAVTPFDEGGAIRNFGNLTILNSVITNNVLNADNDALGGGIYNSGTLTVTNSSITNNVANGDDSGGDASGGLGGGIYNAADASATITNSTISGNQANGGTGGDDGGDGSGGGIRNNLNATLIITNSTIADNPARGGNGGGGSTDDGGNAFGGGIRNTSGTVTITGSTISGNQAIGGNVSSSADDGGSAFGGGIRSDGTGVLNLTNSTISGNSADGGNGGTGSGDLGGNGVGGGVSISGGTATIRNSTVTLNDATGGNGGTSNAGAGAGSGGGVADSDADTTSVLSSIIAGNTSESTNPDVSGTFNSEGFNLIGIADPNGFDEGSDQVGTSGEPLDALLDALADNGGPTLTHLPQANSPALNLGNNALNLTTDQRGFKPRDAGAATDVGAVERDANSPAVIAVGSGKKNPGVVNVFDGDGNPILTNLQPYGKKFKGGIRVAVGDLTGDETPDIVVAPNSGKRPIKVYDGATGQEVVGLAILPYGKKYKAGMSIAVGNVIADNVSPGNEIIVGALKKNLPVKVFSVDGVEQSSFIAFNQSNTSGAEVASGNIDGLGLDEVFVLATSNRNRVFILDGLGNTVLTHFIAEALLGRGSIAVGDFNSDGMAEIALGNGAVKKSGGNQVHIYTTSGVLLNSFDAFADPFTGGVRVATADVDNDGVDEVLAGPGAGADLDVLIFDALSSTELDSFLGSEATKKRGIFIA